MLGQGEIFKSVRPEATIVVRKHNTGADLVEVTLLDPKYLDADLRQKIETLGSLIGSVPRGTTIFHQDSGISGSFLKGKFAVDGLIHGGIDRFALAPIIKAFAFGEKPVRQFSVIFDNETPDSNLLRRFKAPGDSFMFEAISTSMPTGIEYRVIVSTNDANLIHIPVKGEKVVAAVKQSSSNIDPLVVVLVLAGSIATGLLVYSVARGSRLRARS